MPAKGGARKGAGRKSKVTKLLEAKFAAPFFNEREQQNQWKKFLKSDDEKIRLDAVKYLTDRLYGKAPQAVEHTGKDGEKLELVIRHVGSRVG